MKTLFAAATLAAVVAASPLERSGAVPYTRSRSLGTRNDDGTVNMRQLLIEIERTVLKYDPHADFSDFIKPDQLDARSVLGAVPLLDDESNGNTDIEYYGVAKIGTSKRNSFTLDFDTGSSDLWVPGPSCSSGCVGSNRYNNGGRDLHNTTTITYGSGQISGENFVDTVTVGGYTVAQQTLISVTSASGFSTLPSGGLMGLAFPSISQSKSTPFFFNLVGANKLPKPQFSFYLGRAASGTGFNSELFIGGANSTLYTGSFHNVPVINQSYWEVAVNGAKVNGGAVLPSSNGSAAVDTGTSVVLAPINTASAIYAKIPGSFVLQNSGSEVIYGIPCNTTSSIAIRLAGKDFAINPLDITYGVFTGNTCIGAVIGANIVSIPNFYVLGDSFLKNWYSTFSYSPKTKKAVVSFAKSV